MIRAYRRWLIEQLENAMRDEETFREANAQPDVLRVRSKRLAWTVALGKLDELMEAGK